jgi:hypothetical protein
VDYYDGVLVANVYDNSLQDAALCETLVRALPRITAIYGKRRPSSLSRLSAEETAALAPSTPLWGAACPDHIVRENGLSLARHSTGCAASPAGVITLI